MFKDIVDNKNLSLYKVSKDTGISYTAINELYRGERDIDQVSSLTFRKLSTYFNISMESFYNRCKSRPKIPEELNKVFWDVEIRDLDILKHKNYIIPRLLSHGGYKGYKFLLSAYTYEEIKEVALTSKSLNKKTANFLKNNFNLNENKMAFYNSKVDWRQI